MDNLIAKKEAVPMIIVMLDGNSKDFNSELFNDCIPLVEKTYRVKTDKDSRALAGLSMGGIQTLNACITHPEYFSYIGVLVQAGGHSLAGVCRDRIPRSIIKF